jgi:hypothetical protein
MSPADPPDKASMICVTEGRDTIGFVLRCAPKIGYEAFDSELASLGCFYAQHQAVAAVWRAHHNQQTPTEEYLAKLEGDTP